MIFIKFIKDNNVFHYFLIKQKTNIFHIFLTISIFSLSLSLICSITCLQFHPTDHTCDKTFGKTDTDTLITLQSPPPLHQHLLSLPPHLLLHLPLGQGNTGTVRLANITFLVPWNQGQYYIFSMWTSYRKNQILHSQYSQV